MKTKIIAIEKSNDINGKDKVVSLIVCLVFNTSVLKFNFKHLHIVSFFEKISELKSRKIKDGIQSLC